MLGKKLNRFIILAVLTLNSFAIIAAGQDVRNKTVALLYQPDLEPTEFDFIVDNYSHSCGGAILRVRSNSVAVANRKFSLLSAALISGNKISFRETGSCIAGGRMEVSWIQLLK
jgi:hypothetical protein